MKSNHSVVDFFTSMAGIHFNSEQEEQILSMFVREEYKPKSKIFINGDSNTRHYFVEKGLLRLFILDAKGKEFNILFAMENQVIGDLATPNPTLFNLSTIENSIVYSISEKKLNKITNKNHDFNSSNAANTIRKSYIFLQKRLVSILSKTAEENYLELKHNSPKLIHRLPQYHIASYLGVSPEFLSKIIKRVG